MNHKGLYLAYSILEYFHKNLDYIISVIDSCTTLDQLESAETWTNSIIQNIVNRFNKAHKNFWEREKIEFLAQQILDENLEIIHQHLNNKSQEFKVDEPKPKPAVVVTGFQS